MLFKKYVTFEKKQKVRTVANVKQGNKNYLEEHSKQKVAFYKKYLTHYLRVLLHAPQISSIHIYDVFCGIGIYPGDGSKGSPVVALETIRTLFKQHPKHKKSVELMINDYDTSKVEMAMSYIEENCDTSEYCRLVAHTKPANEILGMIADAVKTSDRSNAHLVFIDPHGYKDIRRTHLLNILQPGKSEILLFLPVSQMYRFLKPSKEDSENPSYKPLRTFMNEFEFEEHPSSQLKYIDLIKDAFTFKGRYYAASFILQADKKNYYALFLITSSIKGLEKAVETKWELDDLFGKGHMVKQEYGLFADEYEDREILGFFEDYELRLEEFLQKWRSNGEIYEFSLKSGFLPKHTKEMLKRLNEFGKLEFDRKLERKNAFYLASKERKKEKYKVRLT